MSNAVQQRKLEKNREEVTKLSQLADNRECADCVIKSTPYVIMNFGIFVCSFCSGIHRSHQFRVKGISMTNFKDEEVDEIKSFGGNKKVESVWRATWNPSKFPKPKVNEEEKIKDFIRKTYVEKAWYSADGSRANTSVKSTTTPVMSEDPPVEPISKIIKDPTPLKVQKNTTSQKPKTADSLFDEPTGFTTSQQQNTSFGFDDFSADFSSMGNTTQPHQPQQQHAAPPQQPKKSGLSLADELFASVSAPPPTSTSPAFGSGWNNAPQQPTTSYPPQQGYGYGMPPQQHNAFGNANPFGAPAPNAYGAPNANPFGAPAPTNYGSPYGNAPQQHHQQHNAFGNANPFGAPAPTGNAFGSPTGFGNPYGNNTFGQPQQPQQQHYQNPYGNNAFGQAPQQPQQQGFGAFDSNPFGAPSHTTTTNTNAAPKAKDPFADLF